MAALGMVLSVWILITSVLEVRQRLTPAGGQESVSIRQLTRSHWGMILGHVGFAVVLIGITMVSNYEEERDLRMAPGDTVPLAGYDFTFVGVEPLQGPNYSGHTGIMDVHKDGEFVARLGAEKTLLSCSA